MQIRFKSFAIALVLVCWMAACGVAATINVGTVAAMSTARPGDGDIVITAGYTAAGDGGGNTYRYVVGSAATVDGGFVLSGPGAVGRYLAVDQTIANPRHFGAAGNGTADDTAEVNAAAAALTAGGKLDLVQGTYLVSDTILVANDNVSVVGAGIGGSVIATAVNWADKPVLNITGDHCRVQDLSIVEASASAINAAKNGANNIGIDINGAWATVCRVRVDGFGFPLNIRASDASCDSPLIIDSEFLHGYSWGVELDSVRDARFINCTAHDNGLDGFKAQNEGVRTCDGLLYDGCTAYNNGLRDIAAGGAENTNGNGFDIYNGGWRTRLSNCRGYSNYGSGLNVKGGGGVDPVQGEFVCVNSFFTNALTLNTGGSPHGIEIGVNYDNGHSLLQFIGVTCAENDGQGVAVFGGFAAKFTGCNFINNAGDGANTYKSRDVSFVGCNFFKNRGRGGVVGLATDATFLSRRVSFDHCVFSGTYNPLLAASADPRTAASQNIVFTAEADDETFTATAHPFVNGDAIRVKDNTTGTLPTGIVTSTTYWVINRAANTFQLAAKPGGTALPLSADSVGTVYATMDGEMGIRTLSDSADVSITNCSFMNFWTFSGNILNHAKRTLIEGCKFYNAERVAIYQLAGDMKVRDCDFEEMDWTIGIYAAIRVTTSTAHVLDCTFRQASSTGGSRAILYDATATLGRFENLDITNYPVDVTATAGATWDPDWVQSSSGTAAPVATTKYHIVGAVHWNSVPTSGQPSFWRATVAGAPGTWSAGPNHP